jgi:hypothetical protein
MPTKAMTEHTWSFGMTMKFNSISMLAILELAKQLGGYLSSPSMAAPIQLSDWLCICPANTQLFLPQARKTMPSTPLAGK